MTKYDFDKIIDRRNTDCLKYDFAIQRGRPADVLPFWVADMDFPIAREIQEALVERCQHAIFGYSESTEAYFHAVRDWYTKHFNWSPKAEWLTKTPGIVFALAMAVNVKLMLLCSPHNPVGRVWTRAELQKVGDICLKHGVITVSDEIHGDFVWGNNIQTVFASLGEQYEQNCVISTAPSKTFNIAGLQVSNIFIPNKNLRRRFRKQVAAAGYSQVNTLGLVACQAAYTYGEDWLQQVKTYIEDNIEFVDAYLKQNLPQIKLLWPEETYLIWLDCSALGLTAAEREQWLWHKAHLWLDGGGIFGKEREAFERINVACPRALLLQGLEQLKQAVHELNLLIPFFTRCN